MAQVYDSEDLKKAEEDSYKPGSLSTSTGGRKVKYSSTEPEESKASNKSASTSPGDLTYRSDVPSQERSLYRDSSTATSFGRVRFGKLLGTRRRQAAAGGGVVATVVGIVMFFTIASGPFEFIHIAQLLERFHFGGIQTQMDDRFNKSVRFWRYTLKGTPERTRLGFIGNRVANRFETKLNDSGLTSSYTDKFGLFDGYVIDRGNEKFKGMTDDQIKQSVKEKFGVEPVDGSSIKGASASLKGNLVIDASKMGYVNTYKLTYGLLREAGYSKMSAAIGSRYLCTRALCTTLFHPMTKQVGKSKRALEDWWAKRKTTTSEGDEVGKKTAKDGTKDKSGGDLANEVNGNEEKPPTADSIHAKLTAGGLAALGILCVAKDVTSQASSLKAGQIQVLMRMAVESMAIGSQLESGQDVNLAQLAQYDTLLSGKDPATGKTTSWDEAESIQANLGKDNTGISPNDTVSNVTDTGTPFDFLNAGIIAKALNPVCSSVGQFIQILLGSVSDAIIGEAVSIVLTHTGFMTDLANWLAGDPINVNAVGADFGSEIDFGAALAANGQSMLAGGTALTPKQSTQLRSVSDMIAADNFASQSLAHRLFSPYDQQSLISRAMDSSSHNVQQNITSMTAVIFHPGRLFTSLGSLFGGTVKADTGSFDYGFPTIGFTQADMSDSKYENPYDNACRVVGCPGQTDPASGVKGIAGFLTDSTGAVTATGQAYIDLAHKCFGAKVTPDANGQNWDVVSDSGTMPNPYDSGYPGNCGNTSDVNWTRLRFFILDTQTMNTMGCYQGDSQACSDIGFTATNSTGQDSNSGTNGTGTVDEGTNAQLAQKLLGYQTTGQYHCDNPGDCTDLHKIVDGQSLAGSDGCQAQTLDPRVLQLLLYLIENGGFKIGTFALCGDHHFDGLGGHSGGKAVDISSVNGASLAQDSQQTATEGLKLDKYLNNLPANIKLDQQISYGYGGHYYQPMSATQQYGGQLCNSSCVSIYTLTVENQHTNHIHAGY
jgi:hypothetical protein